MTPATPASFRITIAFLCAGLISFPLAAADREYEVQGKRPPHLQPPPSPALSPAEALKTIQMAPGFRIDLIVSEPLIEDPVIVEFDTKGNLWVVEMRGFMQDIEANGQFDPVGRVSVCFDDDGDGTMDRSTVFADGLILPRALRILPDGVLVAGHEKLWFMEDFNGDFAADRRTVIDPEYATNGSVEHRPNGLLAGIDNWIYNAKSGKRYRRKNGSWVIDETELRGQWGISQDDYGRLYYNFNWSQLHADLAPPNTLSRHPHFTPALAANAAISSDQRVFPIRMNTGVNRGYRPGILDSEGRLREFASACSPWIYRADLFPEEFHGNAFVCAPGANTVKRNLVRIDCLAVTASNGYPDRDFAASTDERFRPVSLAEGPDGALYLVDMYRGIIQQSEFMTTFLREESIERGLAGPIHLGRIYRIAPENSKKAAISPFPEDSAGLVELLHHPSGWWRDRAQERLIFKGATDQLPALEALATGEEVVPALHALYVLEGLDRLRPALLSRVMEQENAALAGAACRLLAEHFPGEPLALPERSGEELSLSIAIALGTRRGPVDPLLSIATRHSESALIREAVVSGLEEREQEFLQAAIQSSDWNETSPGKHSLLQMVAAAGSASGNPETIAAILGLSPAQPWQEEALSSGLLAGLQELEKAPTLSQAPEKTDPGLAALLNWPGHEATAVAASGSAEKLSRQDRQAFLKGQAHYSSLCASCHGPAGRGLTPLAPPLRNSDWVTGDPDRLAKVLLHGLEGPIEIAGKRYEPPQILPSMPPVGMMTDRDIAAIMTYIRRAWGHTADPVSAASVRRIRDLNMDRRTAWKVSELPRTPTTPR